MGTTVSVIIFQHRAVEHGRTARNQLNMNPARPDDGAVSRLQYWDLFTVHFGQHGCQGFSVVELDCTSEELKCASMDGQSRGIVEADTVRADRTILNCSMYWSMIAGCMYGAKPGDERFVSTGAR